MIFGLDQKTIVQAIVGALIWAFTYYFIRRGLNPLVTDVTQYQTDAVYGALASFASKIITALINNSNLIA